MNATPEQMEYIKVELLNELAKHATNAVNLPKMRTAIISNLVKEAQKIEAIDNGEVWTEQQYKDFKWLNDFMAEKDDKTGDWK